MAIDVILNTHRTVFALHWPCLSCPSASLVLSLYAHGVYRREGGGYRHGYRRRGSESIIMEIPFTQIKQLPREEQIHRTLAFCC